MTFKASILTVSNLVVAAGLASAITACSSEAFEPAGPGGASGTSGGAGATNADSGGSGQAGSAGAGAGKVINPTGAANGTSCGGGDECATGNCVDGVCCNTACDGTCEACDVSGSEGACTPHAEGQDPESECGGTDSACAGSCNGQGACMFPEEKSCGTASCSGGVQSEPRCDNTGACSVVQTECGAYACGTSACNSSCAGDGDCAKSDYYCNPTSKKCEARQKNGATCGAKSHCESGNCVDGVCCNTACAGANFACTSGVCSCGGKVCGSGESCVNWFRDADGDGYGDPNQTTLGCSTSGPKQGGYVSNANDCYDSSANAKPGQTKYFTKHRGDGSFDYDCSGAEDQERDATLDGATCGSCAMLPNCSSAPGYCSGSQFCLGWKTEGWEGISVPKCGATAPYGWCITNPQTSQVGEYKINQTQACR